MDALGCRGVMRSPRHGGVLHWLAGMGARDIGNRDADNAVSCCQRRARCCSTLSRPHRLETTYAQPRHTSRDPRQRRLLPHPSNCGAEPSVTGRLYRHVPLRALLLVGVLGGVARRCT